MKVIHIIYIALLSLLLPGLVFAQTTFAGVMTTANDLIRSIVPVIVSIAVIVFLWGVTSYIRNADEPAKREEGRQLIIYGLIAIFVMVSMWGFVNLIISTVFGNDDVILEDSDVEAGPFLP